MIEPMAVPHATAFPQACRGCGTQKGPFVDYHVEDVSGHLYLCVNLCVKTAARLAGFAPGAKLDELQSASDALSGRDREIDSLRLQLGKSETAVTHQSARIEEISQWLEDSQNRVRQLEGRLRENAEIALSLVGGEAA